MRPQLKDQTFNSKELNNILPSYLLDEIDEEVKEQNDSSNSINNALAPEKQNSVRKNNFL